LKLRYLLGAVSLFAYSLFVLPLVMLFYRAIATGSWQNLPQPDIVIDAVWLSLWTSGFSLLTIVILGTPLAYVLARWDFPAKWLANVVIELPIVMPPAVAGLALLLTFGRQSALGNILSDMGIQIPFTSLAVIIAQTFVASPFFIRAAQLGFSSISNELEDAARVDGGSSWQIFLWITLPLSLRALAAGLILSWARAIGEFGATIFFAGNLQGRTQTMPLLVYAIFERDIDAAIWTGLLLIGIAFMALLASQWVSPKNEQEA
jgi:molybdate transport system permease protein